MHPLLAALEEAAHVREAVDCGHTVEGDARTDTTHRLSLLAEVHELQAERQLHRHSTQVYSCAGNIALPGFATAAEARR